ncbi:K+-dependent Na+/Ca+ exchanger related-protein [Roseovarius sp. EC-HK134]|uniref:calcium/sodium antiporter n=1 Tax=unclassified Roseovarius TaxID=2614913 RepID=UPI0012513C55|nr:MULTISPECIES: calcium/sodium antiporter [unclassified Roseovarius]VVT25625.1 K+-dependent Na+/Ca+ exchanger related-protein [Roseovarius sp. EC-HK134]VVT25797.1 K+-dependent Na+/Ca+ exchanger related-protein [Roseovarius sp. EC-SD190]
MLHDLVLVAAGLVLLFVGGEALVRGAVAIAERMGVSKLLIGLVIVGFGTSTPELLVSVKAALDGASEIALGNVVGSNIANILLIFGLAAVIAPVMGWARTAVREALVATLVSLVAFALVQGAVISRMEGIAMLLVLVGYLVASYWLERRDRSAQTFQHEAEAFAGGGTTRRWVPPLLALGGIVALVFGADLLVEGAVNIARVYGVPDAVIGLSLVAIGTSLPELATAIVAAIRRQSDVVLGNVIGSNIFNILAILGVTVVIQPIEVSARFRDVDTPVMLGVALLLLALLFATRRIGRGWGLVMLGLYAAYMVMLFTGGMVA